MKVKTSHQPKHSMPVNLQILHGGKQKREAPWKISAAITQNLWIEMVHDRWTSCRCHSPHQVVVTYLVIPSFLGQKWRPPWVWLVLRTSSMMDASMLIELMHWMNGNEGRFGLDFETDMVVNYRVPVIIAVCSVRDVVPCQKVRYFAKLRENPVICQRCHLCKSDGRTCIWCEIQNRELYFWKAHTSNITSNHLEETFISI